MTLRPNSPQAITRLLFRCSTTPAVLHLRCRRSTVGVIEAKRIRMEKTREQIYAQWSQTELISRILELERSMETVKPIQPRKPKKTFNSSLYSTRHIALKIAYLGANYGGFEYHVNNPFSTPTVEEQIFKALLKARLVPHNGLPGEEETVLGWPGDEAVEYSKCGRTDKGVSAFGQVIGIRVRSNKPLPTPPSTPPEIADPDPDPQPLPDSFPSDLTDYIPSTHDEFTDANELPYPQILNRLLPPDIRILSWCPTPPPNFSARFNCAERHYRYFFTNPPIPPTSTSPNHLNIPLMREAATLFIGDHDFRNFCKLDASKQISCFDRIIRHADIVEVTDPSPRLAPGTTTPGGRNNTPKLYYFTIHGSAFLWHQVRHMVALLFLIGQGLEPPSLIASLLDTQTNPCKPLYEMADDRALVLWDCVFPEGMLEWVPAAGMHGRDELVDTVWALWHKSRVDEVLAGGLLDVIGAGAGEGKKGKSQVVVNGGHEPVYRGRYVPVLERKRMEDVEVINKRYVDKKGDWAENRNRRVEARKAKARAVEDRGRVVE